MLRQYRSRHHSSSWGWYLWRGFSVTGCDGVAPASPGSGYYLVKGSWLPPRLDVIGYADDVDWYALLDRLKRVTEGEQAIIE